jgi:glycosyltransferase involved in cell wall biosynthesis
VLKVIHLIPHDGIGGVEAAARSMAGADSLGCQFKLLLIAGKTISENPHRILESPFQSADNPLAHCLAVFRVLREKPDVLICSLWRSMLVGLSVKLLRPKMKLVCFLHLASTVNLLDRMLNNLALRFCDAVWADSKSTLDSRLSLKYGKPTEIISFVLSHPEISPAHNPCAPRFVFWGRLHRQKGLDRAIQLIAELVKKSCHAQFEIWGPDDGEKANLFSLICSLGLENHVHFMGPARPSAFRVITQANSFFLQLSRVEGMAMSVVEAMQFGLVPVVTPVGEIAEYCRSGENALVVEDPDNPAAAINDVIGLLGDEIRYRQHQCAAQEHWSRARLYRDDVCRAAENLVKK